MSVDQQPGETSEPGGSFRPLRLLPLAVLAILIVAAYASGWHRELSLETLLRHRSAIDQFIDVHRVAAILVFVLIYTVTTALALPAGLVLTIVGGFLFGVVTGWLMALVGATTGATIMFLLARSALGEHLLRRVGPYAERFAAAFRADAFSYIMSLRLMPTPSWFTNVTSALLGVRLPIFVGATVAGRLPGSLVLALFGAGLDSVLDFQEASYRACLAAGRDDCRVDFDPAQALTPTLLAALVALGCLALLPVIARRLWWRRTVPAQSGPS